MQATKVIAAVLLLCVAAGCTSSSDDGEEDEDRREDPPAVTDITWKPCTDLPSSGQGTAEGDVSWECGTLQVPLDYEDTEDAEDGEDGEDGEEIGIAMIRGRTSGAKKDRIGSLLFNFGGPGGSGVDSLPTLAPEYTKLRERYDLVSFDPRGVGRSEGVRCYGDRKLDAYFSADNTPDDAAEEKAYLNQIKDFANTCAKKQGPVLPHLTTENTARDMDRMRAALGDDKLHYFGASYGTELGAVYAHLFPENVGRAVLDSPVDPTLDSAERSLGQAKGFQRALRNYADDCAEQGDSCPIGDEPKAGTEEVGELLTQLDGEPIPASGRRELTESLATGGVAQSLYSKDLWPLLSQGLRQAEDDDGATLLALSDALNGRGPDGHYSTLQASFVAIGCADTEDRYSVDDIKERLPEFRKASPVFGDFMGWSLAACTAWPATGSSSTPEVGAADAAPILLVASTGDPATPYEGMAKMADALGGEVAIQLTREGEGHGAYTSSSTCTRDAVNTYLLKGDPPDDGRTCTT